MNFLPYRKKSIPGPYKCAPYNNSFIIMCLRDIPKVSANINKMLMARIINEVMLVNFHKILKRLSEFNLG